MKSAVHRAERKSLTESSTADEVHVKTNHPKTPKKGQNNSNSLHYKSNADIQSSTNEFIARLPTSL
jgi:hypothetical protein